MNAAVEQYEKSLPAAEAPEYGSVQIMKDLVPRLIGPQVCRMALLFGEKIEHILCTLVLRFIAFKVPRCCEGSSH